MFSRTEAARQIGVRRETLWRWEQEGRAKPSKRHARSGNPIYTADDIERLHQWKDAIVDNV